MLFRLLEEYAPLVHQALQSKQYDEAATSSLRDVLVKLTGNFVPRRRFLYAMSYVQHSLHPYQVFLSHAGEQKSQYATWIERELTRRGVSVFFDERSLKGGDRPDDVMLNAALTCRIAIVVVSPEYIQKTWPLLELSIFAARLVRQREVQRLPAREKLTDDELTDLAFHLLPDFYCPDRKGSWIQDLDQIPTPIRAWPTGYRKEEKLDDDHAQRIVERVLELLSHVPKPVSLDLVSEFRKLYAEFRKKRNAFFGLAPKKDEGEGNVDFLLRLVQWYEPQKRSNSDADQAAEAARDAGRHCLTFALTGDIFRTECEVYLVQQGYAELANVYTFTAPLDALNWKVDKSPNVPLDHWSRIASLNKAAGDDIFLHFLKEYVHIQDRVRKGELNSDPFPSADLMAIRVHLMQPHQVPELSAIQAELQKLIM